LAPSRVENPTLIERFVKIIPLPYPLAALVWTLVIPSGPAFYAIQYLVFGAFPLSILNVLLNFLLTLYLLLIVHYMRLRVVADETSIAARLSGGVEDFQRAFGKMTQTAPVIILGAISGTFILLSYAYAGVLPLVPGLVLGNAIVVYLNTLSFLTYLWEFAAASWGLHKLGGPSLKLGSFLEDRMMGSRPMGNLALSLTLAYFGVLLLTFLLFSTFLPASLVGTASFYGFVLVGIALFFLPLNGIHAKMQAEKRRLLHEIGARYPRINPDPSTPKESATLDDVHTRLTKLTDLKEVEMLDRKIATLPTWPFDIQVVSKFVTIVLSVTAVLLSRLITGFLHI
jgi:hypothetical protein